MSFSTILFTEKGRTLQAKALAGATLNFTSISMGSGSLSGQSQLTLTSLIEPKVVLNIAELNHDLNYATIKGNFSNSDINIGFYWREIGVFALDPDLGEILYCYGNAGALAEYIPPQTSEIIEKVVGVSVIVGNASSVTAVINESIVYASKAELDTKADRSTTVIATLLSSGWVGVAAPFSQIVAVNGVTATNTVLPAIAQSATDLQYSAGVDAQLHPYSQDVGSITIRAMGDKPAIDIPMVVCILG